MLNSDARVYPGWVGLLLTTVLVLGAMQFGGAASAQDPGVINGQVVEQPADPDAGLIASLRFAGQQRFATAALIALETWDQSDRAIIARHDEWPDALAGGYLAGVFGAPVLLVSRNDLQDDTLTALEELGVSEVTLLGGTQAVSEANAAALRTHGYDVERISGPTRFHTAAAIARAGGVVGELDSRRTAVVTTGQDFADALAVGPLAYAGPYPILLTPSHDLHPAVEDALQDLDIERVLLLGGTAAVSAEVEEEIRDVIEGDEDSVTRLSGRGRVETTIRVAEFSLSLPELDFNPFEHGWARGNEFADALTIGPRLGEIGGPLLLVPTPTVMDTAEGSNAAFAERHGPDTSRINIAGGAAALSQEVERELRRAFWAAPAEVAYELNVRVVSSAVGEVGPEEVDTLVLDGEHFPKDQFFVVGPEEGCEADHYHSAGEVHSLEGGTKTDPDSGGCGYGKVGEVPEVTVAVSRVAVEPAKDGYDAGEQVTLTAPEEFESDGYRHSFSAWMVEPEVPHEYESTTLWVVMETDVTATAFYESVPAGAED